MRPDPSCGTLKRMGIGSILVGCIFLVAGLGIAWFGNNMDPVSGLGILVLMTIGVVVGADKKRNDHIRQDYEGST